jgi:hypothetical protein
MPALSKSQQALMAIALHNPSKLKKKNQGVLKMSKEQLDEYASTPKKNLPKRKNSLLSLAEGNMKTAQLIVEGKEKRGRKGK